MIFIYIPFVGDTSFDPAHVQNVLLAHNQLCTYMIRTSVTSVNQVNPVSVS